MLFDYLYELKNNTNEEDFRELMNMCETDIKFNRLGFNKTTNSVEFIRIMEGCKSALIEAKHS